jgi:hypothetical protein
MIPPCSRPPQSLTKKVPVKLGSSYSKLGKHVDRADKLLRSEDGILPATHCRVAVIFMRTLSYYHTLQHHYWSKYVARACP